MAGAKGNTLLVDSGAAAKYWYLEKLVVITASSAMTCLGATQQRIGSQHVHDTVSANAIAA